MCMLKCRVCGKNICSCYDWGNGYLDHLKSCGDQWEQGKWYAWRGFFQYCEHRRYAELVLLDDKGKNIGSASGGIACLHYKYNKDWRDGREKIEADYKADNDVAVLCKYENCPLVAEKRLSPTIGLTHKADEFSDKEYVYKSIITWKKEQEGNK